MEWVSVGRMLLTFYLQDDRILQDLQDWTRWNGVSVGRMLLTLIFY